MKERFNNAPEYVFNNPNYISYVVEYQGDLIKEASLSNDYYITIIDDKYAVITFKFNRSTKDIYTLDNNPFPSIVYISRYYIYNLLDNIKPYNPDISSISPVITSNINNIRNFQSLDLSGRGVVVGIIGTGIDYTNDAFIDKNGKSRILSIWDQTIQSVPGSSVPFGREFSNEEINNALSTAAKGGNPYDIVNTKDEAGNSTAMAGIIGAKDNKDEVIGAAPECSFIVVKLQRAEAMEKMLNSNYLYDMASMMLGVQYLHDYVIENNTPMVIYISLGTTLGNHYDNGIFEQFIDCTCYNIGISVVTSTGNEGEAANHASGNISSYGQYNDVDIYVSEEQKFLRMELWVKNPNVMSVEIFSPSGETTGKIPVAIKKIQINKFVFERTQINVLYYLSDALTTDELVFIAFDDLQPGIWKCRIYGEYILDGRYDMWMYQKKLLLNGTRFLAPDYYGTITNPSPGRYSLTVTSYNQNNFSIVGKSGVYFKDTVYNAIDVACGGVDIKTYAPQNKLVFAEGTGAAGAVAAGAAAIMMQWGIIEKNNVNMYSQTLKSYFLRGTIKRPNDVYPNPQWGYGILDLVGVFRSIE